jgi:hypothetical protein
MYKGRFFALASLAAIRCLPQQNEPKEKFLLSVSQLR